MSSCGSCTQKTRSRTEACTFSYQWTLQFEVTCFIPLLLWLCRFLLGRCAKRQQPWRHHYLDVAHLPALRYTRVPPQLYTPVRRLPVGLEPCKL